MEGPLFSRDKLVTLDAIRDARANLPRVTRRTPIVPVGVVGCEETMPSLVNVKPLARMLGMPYFPLAPLVPLPARVFLNFGKPMHFANDARNERDVEWRVEEVKDAIRDLIDAGIAQRKSIF